MEHFPTNIKKDETSEQRWCQPADGTVGCHTAGSRERARLLSVCCMSCC